MAVEMSKRDSDEIKAILGQAEWRDPEKSFVRIMLIFLMMSLIGFSFTMVFWDVLGSNLFSSVSLLSVVSMLGAGLQIYSYSSDTKGY